MPLSPKIRQAFKARAHALKPIIMIGNNGLSDAVNKEIDRALYDHELIKIKIQSNDRAQRREWFEAICAAHTAELVQVIGSIGVIYKKRTD
jgi:RNA-binding protein